MSPGGIFILHLKKETRILISCIAIVLSALLIICLFSQCTHEIETNSSSTNSEFTSVMVSEANTSSNLENPENIVIPQSSVDVMEEISSVTETVTPSATVNENSDTSQKVSSPQSDSQPISAAINEGNIVYADLKKISEPTESDFGKYYSYAVNVYQQHITGVYEDETFEFDSSTDADAFLDQFNNTCLKNTGIVLHLKSQTSNYGKTQIKLFQLSVQDYQDLIYKQNTILSIIGNGITERTVIERLINWCIANCSYDYNYQAHYVMGLLQDKKGICADFTNLVCDVCELYGIPCEYISSPDDGRDYLDRHAWNRVCIGGTWYYVDVTWSVCCGYNAYPLTETLWENHYQYL